MADRDLTYRAESLQRGAFLRARLDLRKNAMKGVWGLFSSFSTPMRMMTYGNSQYIRIV